MVEWFQRFQKTRYDCAAIPTDFIPYASDPELDVVLDLSVAAQTDRPEPMQLTSVPQQQQQQQEVETSTTMDATSSTSRMIPQQQRQQSSSPFAPAPTTHLVHHHHHQQQQQSSSPFAPAPTTHHQQQQQQQSFKKVPEAVVRPSSILPNWTTPTAFCVQPRQQQYHPLSSSIPATTPQPMILSELSYPVRLHHQQQQQQQSGSELETFWNSFQTLTDTVFQTNFLREPPTMEEMDNPSDSFQWGQQQQQQPILYPAGNDNTNDIVTGSNSSSLDESIQRLLFEM